MLNPEESLESLRTLYRQALHEGNEQAAQILVSEAAKNEANEFVLELAKHISTIKIIPDELKPLLVAEAQEFAVAEAAEIVSQITSESFS